jgi:hypothetical protein
MRQECAANNASNRKLPTVSNALHNSVDGGNPSIVMDRHRKSLRLPIANMAYLLSLMQLSQNSQIEIQKST